MTSKVVAVNDAYIIDSKTNDTKSIRRIEVHSLDYLARFYKAASDEAFYEAAEAVLAESRDPLELAHCAETAGRRSPGGAYYRSLLWLASLQALESRSSSQRVGFTQVCESAQTPLSTANTYIRQARALKVAVDSASEYLPALRDASDTLLHRAQRQRDRAVEYLLEAATILSRNPQATSSEVHRAWCLRNGSIKSNLDIIKPSDWWAFSHPKWRQEEDFPGSIPGEVYANALFYFAPTQGVAVDPMAGSGMLRRVYNDRFRWEKDSHFDLDIRLFDLHPRRDFIQPHDASFPLPATADWIFLDPPYFGQSHHLYEGDLASATDYSVYLAILATIVRSMAQSLNSSGRLCVLLPKWSGLRSNDPNYNLPADVSLIATESGLRWIDCAFVSRGRQQEPGSAVKNNSAKRNRRMRSDACVLNVFEKE